MVLFWCRTKQTQLRALSNQFKRCYFQIHAASSSVIHETKIGALNSQSLTFHRTGSKLDNHVRFFAAPVQAKPKYEEKDNGKPKMNEEITAQYVRLVTDDGHGVVSRREALDRARRLNVDLVEVQGDGKPPVCKLMDYKKEMYLRHVKEKEKSKKKPDLVLRTGDIKVVRIPAKISKNDLQTKADTVKRLAEGGHRVKCMTVPDQKKNKESMAVADQKSRSNKKVVDKKKDKECMAVGTEDQDLGGLLSRFMVLIDGFSLVESGPKVESKQAFAVVRHVKFGPLKKGGKKKLLETSAQSSEQAEQNLDECGSETEEDSVYEETVESDEYMMKFEPETPSNVSGSENRYRAPATTNQTNVPENRYARKRFEPESQSQNSGGNWGQGGSERGGMFGAPKPNNESGPTEVVVNRYKKGPPSSPPPSDYQTNRGGGPRGDYGRERQSGGFRR